MTSPLAHITNYTTPDFTLNGLNTICKVLDAYDADTVTVGIELRGFGITKITCRLLGIDTPEMRGGTDHSKHLAICARNRLIYIVSGVMLDNDTKYSREYIRGKLDSSRKLMRCMFGNTDKYERHLITLYDEYGINVNELLITEGHAKKYEGGKKEGW
tara:strand:+ start:1432 stop:1905 length:474 start_codon:yes stop_codon:yes gene_type:complete